MQLDEVDLVDAQSLEGAPNLVARRVVGALAGLRCKEEAITVPRHPGADPQLRIAVARGYVDVVDAVLDQAGQHFVRRFLTNASQRRGPEDRARTVVSCAPKRQLLDHLFVLASYVDWLFVV